MLLTRQNTKVGVEKMVDGLSHGAWCVLRAAYQVSPAHGIELESNWGETLQKGAPTVINISF